jgi:DNA-binding transcriptional MerR regulator
VFSISVAAELTGLHPHTLRLYEQEGLLSPARSPGGVRRYSTDDIGRLQQITALTSDGINLPVCAGSWSCKRRHSGCKSNSNSSSRRPATCRASNGVPAAPADRAFPKLQSSPAEPADSQPSGKEDRCQARARNRTRAA